MKLLAPAAGFFLLVCSSASAQRSHAYWFAGPGAITSAGHSAATIQLGAGGEIALPKGLAVGLEAGAVGRPSNYTGTVSGIASLNGYYHFIHSKSARLDPFATAGYSLFFRHGTANLFNYGGGLNYWFLSDLALRAEIRDHVYTAGGPAIHFWGFRFGLAFTRLWP